MDDHRRANQSRNYYHVSGSRINENYRVVRIDKNKIKCYTDVNFKFFSKKLIGELIDEGYYFFKRKGIG